MSSACPSAAGRCEDRRALRLVAVLLVGACGAGDAATEAIDAMRRPPVDAQVLGCIELPRFETPAPVAPLDVPNAGTIVREFDLPSPSGGGSILGVAMGDDGAVYAVAASWSFHRIEPETGEVTSVDLMLRKSPSLGMPGITSGGSVLAAGARAFVGFGPPLTFDDLNSVGVDEVLSTGGRHLPNFAIRGVIAYSSTSRGRTVVYTTAPDTSAVHDFSTPRTETTRSGDLLRFGVGNVLVRDSENGSDFLDATTGAPLGSLVDADGSRVGAWLPTPDGLILARRPRWGEITALDHCGVEQWRAVTNGTSVPRLIGFDGAIITGARQDATPVPDAVEVLDRSGVTLAGPARGYDPLLLGADGTLYARACVNSIEKRLVALAPDLSELWSVDTGTCPTNAVLGDDGILYVGADHRILAIATTSPGLAPTWWPSLHHDNRNTLWAAP